MFLLVLPTFATLYDISLHLDFYDQITSIYLITAAISEVNNGAVFTQYFSAGLYLCSGYAEGIIVNFVL